MTDFETVAQAEDRSFATGWVQELIEEMGAPVFDGTCWTFPVSSEGEGE
jgi:hypothetical protein